MTEKWTALKSAACAPLRSLRATARRLSSNRSAIKHIKLKAACSNGIRSFFPRRFRDRKTAPIAMLIKQKGSDKPYNIEYLTNQKQAAAYNPLAQCLDKVRQVEKVHMQLL